MFCIIRQPTRLLCPRYEAIEGKVVQNLDRYNITEDISSLPVNSKRGFTLADGLDVKRFLRQWNRDGNLQSGCSTGTIIIIPFIS